MGAGQSTDGNSHTKAATSEVKTSYYELLGVEKTATDDDIKKAYRRKALSLHPDRNYGREEAATSEFAEVQSAYEVLSDLQERAWYDSHEDAIPRDIDPTAPAADGGAGYEESVGLTSANDITRLLRNFHGGTNFDDSPSGFFGFLRDFFDQLAKEEQQAARRQNAEETDFPSFGHKADTHEDGVKQFYNAWSGFSTVKSFAWRDKYRSSDADDRRMRRLIEKENFKFRKEGAIEFNDAVKSFVAFVRRRDPRYTPNTQTEAERQKVLQDASKAQAARMRAANERTRNHGEDAIPVWARTRGDEQAAGQGVEEGTFEESSSEEEHFECMACRKTFKSERQYEAHEKSNKHKKAVYALRKKLQKEGHSVGLDHSNHGDDVEDASPARTDNDEDKESIHAQQFDSQTASPQANAIEDESDCVENSDAAFHLHSTPAPDEQELSTRTGRVHLVDPPQSEISDRDEQDIIPSPESPRSRSPSDIGPAQRPKKGKAALKREKKAAQAAATEADASRFKCVACNAAFPSKTRLFQHLRDFGHAAPPAQGKYKQPTTAGKKKKDRNI